ncbi:MAG: ester cyclase [Ignavibacteriaceae bacterium]|nr:ester cyclase [Ignavibacteriaceae bacterium]
MKNLIKTFPEVTFFLLIIVIVVFSGCQQQKDYSRELKPLVDKYVEVWNTGKVDELDAVMSSDFVRQAGQTSADGLDKIKELITGIRTTFPDLHLVLTDEIFSENRFAANFSFTATNTGPGQFPPTGKSVEVWGVVIAHFENGKLTEEWVGYDNQSFMEQLGFKMMPMAEEKK